MEGSKQEIKCPECGQRLNVPEGYTDFAGCPTCMNKIEVYKGRVQKSKPEAVLSIWLHHAGSIRLFLLYIGSLLVLLSFELPAGLRNYAFFIITLAYLVFAPLVYLFERAADSFFKRIFGS